MNTLQVVPVTNIIHYFLLTDIINRCRFYLIQDSDHVTFKETLHRWWRKDKYYFLSLRGVYVGFFSVREIAGDTILEMALDIPYRTYNMITEMISAAVSTLKDKTTVCEVLFNDVLRQALGNFGFMEIRDDNKTVLLIKYWK